MGGNATTQGLAVEACQLEKHFGPVKALAGLTLRVPQGLFFGLLGPNGAGKTTLVSVLTTLLRPSAGQARLLGHDVVTERDAVRRSLGIVFQEPALDRELTAREHLELQARLCHLKGWRCRVDEMLARVDLTAHAQRPVRQLSGGLRRRLEIARGLLHRPRILFLDEPTVGLDVAARAAVWRYLRQVHAAGETTLFLTTHSMEEADALCQRVAIVDAGRLVVEGAPSELKAELGGDVVVVHLEQPRPALAALTALASVRSAVVEERDETCGAPDTPGATRLGTPVRVTVRDGPRQLAALLDAVRPYGVVEVTLRRPSLEHVFLHHTGHRFAALGASGPEAAG